MRKSFTILALSGLLTSLLCVVTQSTASATADCTVIQNTTRDNPATPGVNDEEWCLVQERTINAIAGQAFVLNGLARVEGTGTKLSTTDDKSRYYYRARVQCLDPDGKLAFGTDGHRNIWNSIGSTAVYPRGILVAAKTGAYTCTMKAAQENLLQFQSDPSKNQPNKSWTVTESRLTARGFAGGVVSGGQLDKEWPSSINNLGADRTVSEVPATIPATATQIRVSGSVNISSCSFQFVIDIDACSRAGEEMHGTLTLWVRQRTSPTNDTLCGSNGMVEVPVDITGRIHHWIAAGQAEFQRSPSCTGPIVARTVWTHESGLGYVGSGGNTQAGSTHVSVAWN